MNGKLVFLAIMGAIASVFITGCSTYSSDRTACDNISGGLGKHGQSHYCSISGKIVTLNDPGR